MTPDPSAPDGTGRPHSTGEAGGFDTSGSPGSPESPGSSGSSGSPESPGSSGSSGSPDSLIGLVEAKLADSGLDEEARALVLDTLGGGASADRPAPRAYLRSVTAGGFRGIGRTTRLAFEPGPGVTLVTGRNGSGKSSFAEAVEIALTGDNARWRDRSDIWRRSWRNLHEGEDPRVAVELLVEGEGEPATVVRTWHGEDVADSTARLERPGADPAPLSALGWEQDLVTYRPFLPYSELGRMIGAKPSEMYDAVASILGLEQLTAAIKRLQELARECEAPAKAAKAELPGLLERLEQTDDPRAREAAAAIGGRRKDLARAAELAAGLNAADDAELARLRRRAKLTGPEPEAAASAAARIRRALAAAREAKTASAEDARRRADLLARALEHHRAHPDRSACPVCGSDSRLGEEWAAGAREQIRALRAEAEAARSAQEELDEAVAALRRLVVQPAWLPDDAADAWEAWLACRTLADPAGLADRAEGAAREAADVCRAVREAAAKRLADRDEAWRECAGALAAWLGKARAAEEAKPRLTRIKAARAWLRDVHDEVRAERMRPIADHAQVVWSQLRQQSNVALGPVELRGSSAQRKVALDVRVDGIDAPALGVMSQGELHSLAMSLFLPRALLPENPFPFLVIDDPVQSMDPAKVDGLARVLAVLAETRQIIVFTHDTRLPQAFTALRLPATVLNVERGERSKVRVRSGSDPVKQALRDAEALTRTRDMPSDVTARVLPGLCRTALEAALVEPARRRLLAAGVPHTEAERRIGRGHKLTELASLALYGDAGRPREAVDDLVRACGDEAGQLIRWCNKGAHEAVPVADPDAHIRRTAELARKVRAL